MRFALLALTLLVAPNDAFAGLVDVNMKYGSYDLYKLVMDFAARYFNIVNSMLLQGGWLTNLASCFLVMAFLYNGFRVYKEGLKALSGLGASFGISLMACIIFLNPLMTFSMLQFSIKFPMDMATFFMEALAPGAGSIMQETSLNGISSVESLFDILDQTLIDLLSFSFRLLPSGNLLFAFAQIVVKIVLLLTLPFLFIKIYFRALMGVFLPSLWIVISFVLAPFFGVAAIFPWLRGYVVSLSKAVFYNWMVMIVNAICIAIVLSVATGLVADIVKISNNNDLLANGLFLFLVIWLWLGHSLLAGAQSYVSQVTEIRGTTNGGTNAIAAVATAGAVIGGKKAIAGGLKQFSKMVGNYIASNGGVNSFRESQKRGITRD